MDPGETTGYAIVTLDEAVIKTGTFPYNQMDAHLQNLQKVSRKFTVIEEVVPVGINAASLILSDISVSFHQAFPLSLWVRAGLWKPIMNQRFRREKLEHLPKRVSRHEGDAIMLALYALRHRKRALQEIFGG